MFFTKSPTKKQKELNVREAYNIWDILKSKYDAIEKLDLWRQFAHDQDLKLLLDNFYKTFNKNIRILENIAKTYSIRGPEKGRLASDWSGNSEPFRDEMIALDSLFYLQEHMENMLQASRTSVTNDHIRKTINEMLKKTIEEIESFYGYLKLKGWIDTPPIYTNTTSNEKISCAEVSHLWNHLSYRFDNKRQTSIYFSLTKDADLKIIIKKGLNDLDNQISILEKECKKFGITMPKRPGEVVISPENTKIYKDDEMYRLILIGLQGAGVLHTKAFKECTVNDRIRKIFKNFLHQEIDYYENFIKYGKIKGWLNPAPRYTT